MNEISDLHAALSVARRVVNRTTWSSGMRRWMASYRASLVAAERSLGPGFACRRRDEYGWVLFVLVSGTEVPVLRVTPADHRRELAELQHANVAVEVLAGELVSGPALARLALRSGVAIRWPSEATTP